MYEKDMDTIEEYNDRWYALQQKYNEFMEDFESFKKSVIEKGRSISECCSSDIGVNRLLNLPKLELPRFDGDVKKWIGFWGIFQKIHDDENLDNNMKFQYLLQATEPGTPARTLVDSFPPSGANYTKAVEQLKARYGRDELLIEVYVRELLALILEQSKGATLSVGTLYDKLETQLQALESLGVTTDKYAAMLRPLVKSALPLELLRAWERAICAKDLKNLLQFIKNEVESEQRIKISRGFMQKDVIPSTSTANCLTAALTKSYYAKGTEYATKLCLFCDKPSHTSSECTAALKLTLDERKNHIKKKNACQICLKQGHIARKCRKYPKCVICCKRHYPLMCENLQKAASTSSSTQDAQQAVMNQCFPVSSSEIILLQTLKINIVYENRSLTVRALLDTGAQRSFLKKSIIDLLKMKPCGKADLSHCLFGGIITKKERHKLYEFSVKNVDGSYKYNMTALEQNNICNNLAKLNQASIIQELQLQGIKLNDTSDNLNEIGLLIGADAMGSLLTGRMVTVNNSLVAIETRLGWTIQGPISTVHCASENTNLFVSFDVEDIWELETLGIKDPTEVKKQETIKSEVLDYFNNTIRINEENRYEVKLPWKETFVDLPTNYNLALKRLKSTIAKLTHLKIVKEYDKQFEEWLNSSIIEVVKDADPNSGHYLPHHAVIREASLTTKIRPVFDASAPTYKGGLSLNDCLHKGSNMIELIPPLLIKFRKGAIGIVSDIKKSIFTNFYLQGRPELFEIFMARFERC